MMRYSLSSGEVKHVVIGSFDTISFGVLKRLFKFGGHHDYEHAARQISLGGQVALRGWQCREFLEDEEAPADEKLKLGDKKIIAALANSLDAEFRLHVYEAHEEKVLLREALEDLEHEQIKLDAEFDKALEYLRELSEKQRVQKGRVFNLKVKLENAP